MIRLAKLLINSHKKYKASIMASMSEGWKQSIVEQNMITKTGTSTNAAAEKIKFTHNYDKRTGKSTVTDKFGTRDSTMRRSSPKRPGL